MCGIVGYIGDAQKGSISPAMLNGIHNRGEIIESFIGKGLQAYTRRLKIVDREKAIQPLFNADKSLCIIYNGEIFNYKELRTKLTGKYKFSTESDTETMLYLWEEYGRECLKMVHGQFAFVIYNLTDKSYVAVRDHLGINPLYYTNDDDQFYFASTLSALVPLKKKILSLEPGTILYSNNVLETYYIPKPQPKVFSESEVLSSVRDSISQAVQMRVDTDLPVGVIYSGGVDSSIVLDQAVRFHSNVTAFTIGKEGSEDFEISKRFCNDRNIKQVIIPIRHSDLNLRAVKKTIQCVELAEYLDIINAVITMPLFREIQKQGIKVVLSGDGSDELFGGYDMYDKISESKAAALFEYKLLNLNRTELQRVDRCAGNFQVENRVPFLDQKVIDVAMKIPQEFKIKGGVEKWCVRKAFESYLPDYILYRKKNPLSHSSGLHEKVRLKKIFFKSIYNRSSFNLHDEMRRDFSITLRINDYDIEKAKSNEQVYQDYTFSHKMMEAVKGFARYYFTPPTRKEDQRCINGNI